MKNLVKFHQKELFRANAVFFVGTISIAILNYSYFPILARLVTVDIFGQVQAALAIFAQFGVLLTAYGYVLTNLWGNETGRVDPQPSINKLETVVFLGFLGGGLITFTFGSLLQPLAKFDTWLVFPIIFLLLLVNIPSTTSTYTLQSKQEFGKVNLGGIIFAAGKIFFSLAVIFTVPTVEGILFAVILAQLISLIYLKSRTHAYFQSSKSTFYLWKVWDRDFASNLFFMSIVVVFLFCLGLIFTFDVVFVRLFLTEYQAGLYSGISAISKIPFFASASVAGVILVSVGNSIPISSVRKKLWQSLGILLFLALSPAIIFALFSSETIHITLGQKYESVSHLLAPLVVLSVLASVNNLLGSFHIARRNYKTLFLASLASMALIPILALAHADYFEIIYSFIASNLIVAVFLSIPLRRLKGPDRCLHP